MKYIQINLMKDGTVKEKTVEDVEVLGENERYIVLNDSYFTKLQQKKEKDYNVCSVVNTCSISDYTDDTFWQKYYGDFSIRMYTTEDNMKTIEKQINREFIKFIRGKIGKYMAYNDCLDIKIELEGR